MNGKPTNGVKKNYKKGLMKLMRKKKTEGKITKWFQGNYCASCKRSRQDFEGKRFETRQNQHEYQGLISRWTDLQVIREGWKRDLLKGVRKKDEEYLEELEDKWKMKLFGESNDKEIPEPIEVFSSPCSLMDFPSLPIEPPYKVDSPLFCDMFPKHIERMRYNKRRE